MKPSSRRLFQWSLVLFSSGKKSNFMCYPFFPCKLSGKQLLSFNWQSPTNFGAKGSEVMLEKTWHLVSRLSTVAWDLKSQLPNACWLFDFSKSHAAGPVCQMDVWHLSDYRLQGKKNNPNQPGEMHCIIIHNILYSKTTATGDWIFYQLMASCQLFFFSHF